MSSREKLLELFKSDMAMVKKINSHVLEGKEFDVLIGGRCVNVADIRFICCGDRELVVQVYLDGEMEVVGIMGMDTLHEFMGSRYSLEEVVNACMDGVKADDYYNRFSDELISGFKVINYKIFEFLLTL